MLNRISSGWIWLETAINAIIDEVNRQKPLGSASIVVEESPNGALLKVVGAPQDQPQPPGSGGGAQEKHILATNIIWVGVTWQDVTVVDPSTCIQSTLSILVHTGNDSDFIVIPSIKHPLWAQP